MDFELSDDQLALRDGARDLLDGLAGPAQVRAVVDAVVDAAVDGGTAYDARLWAAMGEQGWPAVALAEADGGLGLGEVEVAVLLEELGRHAAPAPFASTVLALGALVEAGATDLAARLLDGGVGCVAWSRRADAVVASRAGERWVVSGRPDPVAYAPSASVAVVIAAEVPSEGLVLNP